MPQGPKMVEMRGVRPGFACPAFAPPSVARRIRCSTVHRTVSLRSCLSGFDSLLFYEMKKGRMAFFIS